MILGRNTTQWTSLIAAAAGLAQLLAVQFTELDPVLVASVLGAVVVFLGVFLAFLANTATTPVDDPRLKIGTTVGVLDAAGTLLADQVVIRPTPPGPTGIDKG